MYGGQREYHIPVWHDDYLKELVRQGIRLVHREGMTEEQAVETMNKWRNDK